jgi:hypothetical protein
VVRFFYSSLLCGKNKAKEESNGIFSVRAWNGNDN